MDHARPVIALIDNRTRKFFSSPQGRRLASSRDPESRDGRSTARFVLTPFPLFCAGCPLEKRIEHWSDATYHAACGPHIRP